MNRHVNAVGSFALLAASCIAVTAVQAASSGLPQVSDTPIVNPNTDFGVPAPLELFDKKVMPGIACDAEFAVHAQDLRRVANHHAFDRRSYLENSASAGRRILCPVLRDNASNLGGTIGFTVVGHSANTLPFACALDSYDAAGNWIDTAFDSNTFVGDFVMTLDPSANGLSASASNGFYVLRCTMTAGSRLYSYRWSELTRTDRNN